MRIELAAFTEVGLRLGKRIAAGLARAGETARVTRLGKGGPSLRDWTGENFPAANALVFIGAVGIAVRAIAPHIESKTTDPAVLSVDEQGRYAISLLSGHIGGGNELTHRVASILGATAIVTTATDNRGVFAFDAWAVKNGLAIRNPGAIKNVSGALLAGKTVRLYSAFPLTGELPNGVVGADTSGDCDVAIDVRGPENPNVLHLVPRAATLGIGCRRGTVREAIDWAFLEFCRTAGLVPEAFGQVSSIDLKKDEPGLVAFCRERSLPFVTFTAAELNDAPGDFTASEFVEKTVGVDNVCERSAVWGSCGKLIVGKTIVGGVAMAAALSAYSLPAFSWNGAMAWDKDKS